MIPVLLLSLALSSGSDLETMSLLDFTQEAHVDAWNPVHDGVMGGVSSGRAVEGEEGVRFEGRVRLENNGGFASFRVGVRMPELSSYDGLRLRVRGDGRVYKMLLRTDGVWEGVTWQTPFATVPDEWTVVDLAFEDFTPTWRGRLVPGTGPFESDRIQRIGLLVADKQAGTFAIELAALDAWRDAAGAEEPGSRAAHLARSAALAAAAEEEVDGRGLARGLRWSERVVAVSAPSDDDPEASIQLGHLLAAADDLAARELRVVRLMGERGGRVAGRTIGEEAVRELRELWDLDPDAWTVALVGKDGGVKERWSEPVEVSRILAAVDAMPMRRRETAERRGERAD